VTSVRPQVRSSPCAYGAGQRQGLEVLGEGLELLLGRGVPFLCCTSGVHDRVRVSSAYVGLPQVCGSSCHGRIYYEVGLERHGRRGERMW